MIRINTSSRLYRLLGNAPDEPLVTGCQLFGRAALLTVLFIFLIPAMSFLAVIALGSLLLFEKSHFITGMPPSAAVYAAGVAGWAAIILITLLLTKLCDCIEVVDDRSNTDSKA